MLQEYREEMFHFVFHITRISAYNLATISDGFTPALNLNEIRHA